MTLLFIFSLVFIIANRSISTPDTIPYITFFQNSNQPINSNYYFEHGFQIYTYIIKKLTNSYIIYFAAIVVINCIVLYLAAKNILTNKQIHLNYLLLLCLYFPYFGLYQNGTILRAGLSNSIAILSLSYLLNYSKKKLIVSILLAIVSFSFHRSVLFFITISYFIFFCSSNPKKKSTYFIITACCILIAITSNLFLKTYIDYISQAIFYFSDKGFSQLGRYATYKIVSDSISFSFQYLFWLLSAVFFVYIGSSRKIYYTILNIYMSGLFLNSLLYSATWHARLCDFFLSMSIFLYYFCFSNMRNNGIKYVILIIVIGLQLTFALRIINK